MQIEADRDKDRDRERRREAESPGETFQVNSAAGERERE